MNAGHEARRSLGGGGWAQSTCPVGCDKPGALRQLVKLYIHIVNVFLVFSIGFAFNIDVKCIHIIICIFYAYMYTTSTFFFKKSYCFPTLIYNLLLCIINRYLLIAVGEVSFFFIAI